MSRDEAYLLDILTAARRVLRYTENVSWESFREDDLLQDGVMRNLQIVGEAAQRISAERKGLHPEVPWAPMAGLRNRLVHEYFRVDLERVWQTVHENVAALITLIEPLVPPPEEG